MLRFVQNGTKTCHSTAKTLIFMTMQKLRLYLMHNGVPRLDELFFEHLVCGVKYILEVVMFSLQVVKFLFYILFTDW